ncbi:peptidoglycan-binding protein [Microseira sp. BLCC-F43]|jgi:peptidoglycan hydrolase-like protein with peptidoglycan-binding domain|uniref:peptidoglycan-binding domain-containing protein n=1 Tax=Microseira sp. BLCC-F43 TaxID=3153602 RepID=UPI0035BA0D6E
MQSVDQVQATRSLPTLRLGSKGDDVKYLQGLLNYHDYTVTVDGIFGKKNEAAVKQFQKSRGLKVDGIVGQKTWNELLAESGC